GEHPIEVETRDWYRRAYQIAVRRRNDEYVAMWDCLPWYADERELDIPAPAEWQLTGKRRTSGDVNDKESGEVKTSDQAGETSVKVIQSEKSAPVSVSERKEPRRMTEIERDVLQESFDPPPEHGPYVNDADEQRMREVAQKEIDDQLMVPGVDHYVQMIQEEKGISGTSSIKMPAGVLTGEKPFNMKKDTLISNWYPGIPARDVVYEKFVSDFTYQFDRDSVKKQVEQLQKVGGQCMQLSVET
ncbi:hypothetical protein ADUPG1_002206, partial [Aduncisulcus paluster]